MRCPGCNHQDSRVTDSRVSGDAIRRRRECLACGARYTTHERLERRLPWIVKKDGHRELFDREKVRQGIALACRKRPFDDEAVDELVRRVEALLEAAREGEVPSKQVGETVLTVLMEVDEVAYVRFASVYQAFESAEQFVETIRPLREGRS